MLAVAKPKIYKALNKIRSYLITGQSCTIVCRKGLRYVMESCFKKKNENRIQHCDNVKLICKRVWYANKNYQKKKETNEQKTNKQSAFTTIPDRDELQEQQHDTPPYLYLDHQQ